MKRAVALGTEQRIYQVPLRMDGKAQVNLLQLLYHTVDKSFGRDIRTRYVVGFVEIPFQLRERVKKLPYFGAAADKTYMEARTTIHCINHLLDNK